MPEDATAIITTHLLPGERLLWAGRPKQGFALRGWDIFYIPVSLFMIIMGSALTVSELRRPGEEGGLVFVILWTIAAYWLAFGRFLSDSRKRAHTYYALTGARVIAVTGNTSSDFRSIQLKALKDVTFTKRVDDTGTLEFDRPGFLILSRSL